MLIIRRSRRDAGGKKQCEGVRRTGVGWVFIYGGEGLEKSRAAESKNAGRVRLQGAPVGRFVRLQNFGSSFSFCYWA